MFLRRGILLSTLCFLPLFLASADAPWVSVTVPTVEVEATQERWRAEGIESLSWFDAVTEVSAFEGLQTVRVVDLKTRLTPDDPRWDPWLLSIASWFEPQGELTRIWRPAGGEPSPGIPASGPAPAAITGGTILFLTLLFAILKVVAWSRLGWPPVRSWRGWAGVVLSLVLMGGGATLLVGAVGGTPHAVSSVSWVQHRWFQEAWPWGARWEDWAPGKAWTFPTYERRAGRLVEGEARLAAGDDAWARAAWESLDPKNAARIFGFVNP